MYKIIPKDQYFNFWQIHGEKYWYYFYKCKFYFELFIISNDLHFKLKANMMKNMTYVTYLECTKFSIFNKAECHWIQ